MKQKKGKKLMILFIAFIVLGATAVVTGANKQNSKFNLHGYKLGTDSSFNLSVNDSSAIEDSMVLIWQIDEGDTSLHLAKVQNADSLGFSSSSIYKKDTLVDITVVKMNK